MEKKTMNFFSDPINWLILIAALLFLIAIASALLSLRSRHKKDQPSQ